MAEIQSTAKPKSAMSLKVKLSGALCVLLITNSIYFYFGVSVMGEMNRLVITLYDKVLMSGTYAQMARTDFAVYCSTVALSLTATSEKEIAENDTKLEEVNTTLTEDLNVVKERSLDFENGKAVESIQDALQQVKKAAAEHRAHAISDPNMSAEKRLALLTDWMRNPIRIKVFDQLSDLSDHVVADGYTFRLKSTERTAQIEKTSIAFSITVLITNLICMAFVIFSILPRLKKLTKICADIAAGAFNKRVRVKTNDELGILSTSFNTMLDIVDHRDQQIRDQLVTTNAMINSLSQGFLMVDKSGVCLPIYSQACESLLEQKPAGVALVDVLRVPPDERAKFADWFGEMMKSLDFFEVLAEVGQTRFPHSRGAVIDLAYKPICDNDGELSHMVIIATDVTSETKAREIAISEQAFSRMVSKLTQNKQQFSRFLIDVDVLLKAIPNVDITAALRTIHTIKGGAATFCMMTLKNIAHQCESLILQEKNAGASEEKLKEQAIAASLSLRQVYQDTLIELKDLCDFSLNDEGLTREIPASALLEFYHNLSMNPAYERVTKSFENTFLLEPVETFVSAYNETLREIANKQSKKVRDLIVTGGNIPIFADRYTQFFASLVHVFRNAVDHGIEVPEKRKLSGKDPVSSIHIDFKREVVKSEAWIMIEIRDDGKGIDPAVLRRKLAEKGVSVEKETDQEVIQHVFDASVSTAAEVTDISGRGIGLDAVRAAVMDLHGTILIKSVVNQGTTILIEMPEFGPDQAVLRAA